MANTQTDSVSGAGAGTATQQQPGEQLSKWSKLNNQVHFQAANFVQGAANMKDIILLDNQSTVSIFSNKNLVNNIRPSTMGTLLLHTNGGVLKANMEATVPDFGCVWYNDEAITNIFSLAEMVKKYRVVYDTAKGLSFHVHLLNGMVTFN